MTSAQTKRHQCIEFDRAIADGFVVARDADLRLADLVSRGAADSQFQSRLFGPAIRFCPFCGDELQPPEASPG
jgi:hypothetical protein